MSKVFNIKDILKGTIYKRANCNIEADMTMDFEEPAAAMQRLLDFKGATELRIAVGDYILVMEGISPAYWEGSMFCLWYAISSCQCARLAKVFLIDKETMEVTGVRQTQFLDVCTDILKKHNCIVSFEDNRTVYWTAGDMDE